MHLSSVSLETGHSGNFSGQIRQLFEAPKPKVAGTFAACAHIGVYTLEKVAELAELAGRF